MNDLERIKWALECEILRAKKEWKAATGIMDIHAVAKMDALGVIRRFVRHLLRQSKRGKK